PPRRQNPFVCFMIPLCVGRPERQSVPPYRFGAPGRVDGNVVDGSVVGGPGRPRADTDDLVRVLLAGPKIPEPQGVTFVADHVDGVGQHITVGADAGGAQREVVVSLGFDVLIEQNLLTGDLGVLIEHRRVPVGRIGYRATALDAILLALKSTGVITPRTTPEGHR